MTKFATAEDLLKARYEAFTRGKPEDVDFILKSHHSRTVKDVKRDEIEDWALNSEWLGMEVIRKEKGEATDNDGTIVFCAKYKAKGAEKIQEHWEQSLFEKENGEWRFVDARGVHIGTYKRAEPKVGRNDACPCNSGKKFKKCCGVAA
jgi:SEC-C motif-containing protein